MTFRIEWSIENEEWQQARRERQRMPPGTTFATYVAAGYLLFGTIQMHDSSRQLFPDVLLRSLMHEQNRSLRKHRSTELDVPSETIGGVTMSVSDLATQLCRIVESDAFRSSSEDIMETFEESDGSINIHFAKKNDSIIITSDLFDEPSLFATLSEFLHGVITFIEGFASSVNAQAPELLDWESFATLRPYVVHP